MHTHRHTHIHTYTHTHSHPRSALRFLPYHTALPWCCILLRPLALVNSVKYKIQLFQSSNHSLLFRCCKEIEKGLLGCCARPSCFKVANRSLLLHCCVRPWFPSVQHKNFLRQRSQYNYIDRVAKRRSWRSWKVTIETATASVTRVIRSNKCLPNMCTQIQDTPMKSFQRCFDKNWKAATTSDWCAQRKVSWFLNLSVSKDCRTCVSKEIKHKTQKQSFNS